MTKVIVWSEVAGYIWVEMVDGLLYDELGRRKDLETVENTRLIERYMERDIYNG